ncbi:porin family protein [Niabella hibiscisoli]|uniref:porin family protein n=1 Tax=Niabella hibiscisoli TaxID=1825928 RepID=UPI001F0E16A0|nr:porin family protein [Niabella hibiscisoli]MCH5717460.1 PorT family protein [Niabella hibiscisoli]
MTKRLFIIAAIALFSTFSVNAQFHIGIKAGVNAGKIDGKSFKEEFNYSYLLGGFAEIGLGDKVSINPEVLFSQTSATTDTSFTNTLPNFKNDQIKAKLNYLSIPILLNLRVVGPIHIEAGPQFGILLNKDKKLLENGQDAFKKGDFSMVGGAALHFSAFRVTARYVVGLSNVSQVVNQDQWKNQALQVSLGIAF